MKQSSLMLSVVTFLILLHAVFLKTHHFYLPTTDIQQPILIQGVIDSVPEKKFHGLRFEFHVTQYQSKKINTRMLISWYSHSPELKIGDRWQFTVKLKPPIGSHNPGGFDYTQFLLTHGVSATGYVDKNSDQNKLLSHANFYFLQSFREGIQAEISNSIDDHTIAAFISALSVGLREGLTEDDWQVFQKTGTNHLVAIAGLHIGFVAALFYFLMNKIWRFFPRFMLFLPATRAAEIAALLGAFSYSALSGFAIPAQRASIMLFCFLMGNIFCRPLSMWRRLFLAASIVLILNPFNLIDMSFWLSFLSISILAWVLTARLQSEKGYKSHAKMQAAILIGLLPVMLLFFQQISLVAFVTNAVAIPWVGFIILPVVVFASLAHLLHLFFISQKLFWLSGKLLLPLWKFLTYASHLSFASWHHAISNPYVLIAGIIGAIFLLAPRKFPAKYVGCFGLLPLFFYHPPHPKADNFWVTVIDVGQGLSVLVQTEHHVMLYDTGGHPPGGFDFGESVVAPYLRYRDIHTIDRMEISHGDNDHSGGADAIVKDFKVESIFTSAPKIISHLHARYCYAGQSWIWDNVHFVTLSPVQNAPYADNNSSCVIKIFNQKTQLLLTGDIQKETELQLVQQYGAQLKSDVLQVPHHGSNTSSSEIFLQAVSPKYAIISAGKYNRYHLPSQSIVERYQNLGIKVFNTADSGSVAVGVNRSVAPVALLSVQ